MSYRNLLDLVFFFQIGNLFLCGRKRTREPRDVFNWLGTGRIVLINPIGEVYRVFATAAPNATGATLSEHGRRAAVIRNQNK